MQRRGFFLSLSSLVAGAIAAILGIPGIAFLTHPLRRHGEAKKRRPVIPLKDLPLNEPRRFVLRDRHVDAWTRYPEGPIGAVWLIRRSENEVVAFSAICPHLGCSVDYHNNTEQFVCPCHEAVFGVEGTIVSGPQRRGMDKLEASIEAIDGNEWVSVVYERFEHGTEEKTSLG
jgi:menaquinol-cytochrome c reductase iron-sulfur subunit